MALANPLYRVLALLAALFIAAAPLRAQNVKDGFDPNPDGDVAAIALQADGKILIGGTFTHIGGVSRTKLARLNADGSLDASFNPVIVGTYIYAIAVQGNGQIVIGGELSQVGATSVANIARINANGSVDASFNPMASSSVYALLVQSDGKLLVGGTFSQINGQPCPGIVRLNTDGNTDSGFTPPDLDTGIVTAILQQPDHRVLIGGYLHGPGGSVALMRLLVGGTADSSFQPVITNGALQATVNAMALQPDGHIVFSGNFTSVGAYTVGRLARVDGDGIPDALFNSTNAPALDGIAHSILLSSSGDILLGGEFIHVKSSSRNHVARITRDGALGTYNPNASGGNVEAMALQSDGDLLIGGLFSQVGSTTRHFLARIALVGGYVDATLPELNAGSNVSALAAQPGSGLLVGGDFTMIGGVTRHYLARILPDGSVDASYNPSPDDTVGEIIQLGDGTALVAGNFTHIGGKAQACLAHLDANGAVDINFAPLFGTNNGCQIYGIATQADGKILVFGGLIYINNAGHIYITRLNPGDGSVDTSFAPFITDDIGTNNGILSVAPLPNGQILVGGVLSSVGGHPTADLARLNYDGSLDGTFAPVVGGQCQPSDPQAIQHAVASVVAQPDGKILIGGVFQQVDQQPAVALARLNSNGTLDAGFTKNLLSYPGGTKCPEVASLLETTDGKILAGGIFAIDYLRPNLARFNSNGTLDGTFPDLGVDGSVFSLAIARDGKIVLGGPFTNVGGVPRGRIARLSAPQAAQQSLTHDSGTVTWLRSGSSAELALPPSLYYSSDNTTYAPLGVMTRSAGGWRYDGFSAPVGQLYWLRAQAQIASGQYNGSQGMAQYTQELYFPDDIFKDGLGN